MFEDVKVIPTFIANLAEKSERFLKLAATTATRRCREADGMITGNRALKRIVTAVCKTFGNASTVPLQQLMA
jgi:hypothetical protein